MWTLIDVRYSGGEKIHSLFIEPYLSRDELPYEALQDMGTILWPLAWGFWTYEIAYFFFTVF